MRARASFLLFALFALPILTFGQATNMENGRVQMTELTGPWRFHIGDDPAWANPAFDDSHWSLLRTDRSWDEQGYSGYTGFAWYRITIALPAQHPPLALFLPGVNESGQIFANGQLIGHVGEMPPNARVVLSNWIVFPIPDHALVAGKPLLLAIRVWHWPLLAARAGGGVYPAPRIGKASLVSEWSSLRQSAVYSRDAGGIVEIYSNLLTALAGLGLFLLRRKEREYLWFGLSQLLWAMFGMDNAYATFRPVGYFNFYIAFLSLYTLATFFQIEFIIALLRQRRGKVYWAVIFLMLLCAYANLHAVFAGERAFGLLYACAATGLTAGEVAMLYLGAKQGNVDAPVLVIPYSLMFFVGFAQLITFIPFFAQEAWAQSIRQFLRQPVHWPFALSAGQVAGAFEMFAVLVVLVRRYARSRRDEERLEAELEAARVVQRVLIPEEIPPIPGYVVQTVYKPAGQVGGDFFQIIPLETGGALIAIGDVSGKGLPAAMTVSLLVGTFRTLAHYTRNPSEILSAMNQRMLARSKDGFTTCLVLRLDPDGTLTIANAGHIAPYVGSRELPLVNALPLGLAAGTVYTESRAQLGREDRLTLITDGVVEARSHSGELFGFERTASIMTQDAEQIASTAQRFGQEDDITVLSLFRRGNGEEREPIRMSPAIFPLPA